MTDSAKQTQKVELQRDRDTHRSAFWNAVTAVAVSVASAGILALVALNVRLRTDVVRLDSRISSWGNIPGEVRTLNEWKAGVVAWMGTGTRYTREMAKSDLGALIEKVNDHELRIRSVEKTIR